jgi:hypothetical protein
VSNCIPLSSEIPPKPTKVFEHLGIANLHIICSNVGYKVLASAQSNFSVKEVELTTLFLKVDPLNESVSAGVKVPANTAPPFPAWKETK